jgi:hypothetical protein
MLSKTTPHGAAKALQKASPEQAAPAVPPNQTSTTSIWPTKLLAPPVGADQHRWATGYRMPALDAKALAPHTKSPQQGPNQGPRHVSQEHELKHPTPERVAWRSWILQHEVFVHYALEMP